MIQDVISVLGIANPQLSLTWQDGGDPAEDPGEPLLLKSNAADGEWLAPAACLLSKTFLPRLCMGDGTPPPGSGCALRLHPQVYARLVRLYSRVLEGKTSATDKPQRPVPMYFAYHGTTDTASGANSGNSDPGSRSGLRAEPVRSMMMRDNPWTRSPWPLPSPL